MTRQIEAEERAMVATKTAGRGRRPSIPSAFFVRALRLKLSGLGYQGVADELGRLEVLTSRGSVERLVKGLPPYQDQAVSGGEE